MEETMACLQMLASEMKLPFRKDAIEKILRSILKSGKNPTLEICSNICTMMGLHVTRSAIPSRFATRIQTPSIIEWNGSFALLIESNANGIVLASPKDGIVHLKNDESISNFWPENINVLLVERNNQTPEKKFGIQWFIPSLKKHKKILIQVFLASFVVQLFGLANPLLIQVIIDKVINQRSLDTLQVLGFALVVVTILGGLLGSLRTFLFT